MLVCINENRAVSQGVGSKGVGLAVHVRGEARASRGLTMAVGPPHDRLGLSQAKPSQAKPSQAKPSQAKPSQAERDESPAFHEGMAADRFSPVRIFSPRFRAVCRTPPAACSRCADLSAAARALRPARRRADAHRQYRRFVHGSP